MGKHFRQMIMPRFDSLTTRYFRWHLFLDIAEVILQRRRRRISAGASSAHSLGRRGQSLQREVPDLRRHAVFWSRYNTLNDVSCQTSAGKLVS